MEPKTPVKVVPEFNPHHQCSVSAFFLSMVAILLRVVSSASPKERPENALDVDRLVYGGHLALAVAEKKSNAAIMTFDLLTDMRFVRKAEETKRNN